MKLARRKAAINSVLLACVLALVATIAPAQVVKGSISGTVTDPSGAAVPGAQIKGINTSTGQTGNTVSDDSGLFRLSLLPVGTYTLEVTKSGFRKAAVTGAVVNPGVDTGLGLVKLEVGTSSETVEVSAAAPLVESTQAQVTASFTSAQLNNLPGVGENQGLDNLAVLLPGVSGARGTGFSNTNGVGFSVNGLRARNNDQQIDGQNNNDNSVAGPGLFVGNTEFVDQYQVTTNNFGPEYGRNSGSVVNVITKSGTNTWHGSLFATESNSALDSLSNTQKGFEGLLKPPHYNDLFTGGTIGGALIKNKLFVFGGVDNEYEPGTSVYATGNLTPTPTGVSELAGCYPGSNSVAALQAFGPYAIGGNPTAQTPQDVSLDDAAGAAYAGFTPNNADGTCHVEMGGVQRTLDSSFKQWDYITRADVVGSRDTLYGRYLHQTQTFLNTDQGQAAQGYPVNVPSVGQQFGLSWTHRFSDRMLNELRANYSRTDVQFGGNTLNTVEDQGNLASGLTNVSFLDPGLVGFGPSTSFPQGRIVNTYQLQDNWSYVRGRHQLKAGVNLTEQRSPNKFLPNVNGNFVFSDWDAFAANAATRTSITLGNPSLDFKEDDTFFYVGDDWKVTEHLTLNLGLTYSFYGQPANLFHDNDTKQQTSSSPFWDPSLPLSVTTFPSIPAPKNSVGPSIGFAYSPNWGGFLLGENKTVIRGGYRLAYDPPVYNVYLNIASSAPQVLAQTITPGAALEANPTGPTVRSDLASSLTLGVRDPRTFSETNVSPNFGPDKVHSWSFGIQRELGSQSAVEARYVGNHATNLFQSVNANPYVQGLADGIADGVFDASLLPSGITPCPASDAVVALAIGRENCNLGRVRQRTNTGYSDYNALQTEFRTSNLFHQLTMRAGYTFSKSTSNSDEIFGSFGGGNTYAFSQNPLNYTTTEHGLSGLDFPHTFTLSVYEELPFFRSQHGIVGHVLGGWGIAGTYIWQSGQPYTPVQAFLNSTSNPYNTFDSSFYGAFNSGLETARPFMGNPSAPNDAVGIYAADACAYIGDPTSPTCDPTALAPDTLLSLNSINTTGDLTPVDPTQVHFIANGAQADAIKRTPFGDARRNSLRDGITNTANLEFSKTVNIGERVKVKWHMSMVNAFNHPNYGAGTGVADIDPFIEDAGLTQEQDGFANPKLFSGGHRTIRFGLKISF